MKNLFLNILTFLLFSNLSFAQKKYEVIQDHNSTMSQGIYTALVLEIKGVDKKELQKDWSKFIKNYKAKTKKVKKHKEQLSKGAKILSISPNPINIYTNFEYNKSRKTTTANFWYQLGDGFLNPETHPSEYGRIVEFLQQFAQSVDKRLASEEVEKEEKVYKKLADELKKLEKDNKSYLKKIEEAKETIAKMERNLASNKKDQNKKQEEIANQEQVIGSAKKTLAKF